MNRIIALDPAQSSGKNAELFAAVKSKLGVVPNLMRTLAHSPAALEGYLGLSATLAKGALSAPVREQLALVVAEANGCDYCLAAHTLLGKGAGLDPDAILKARQAVADDAKADALLKFAVKVVNKRGKVCDDALETVRAAGASDAEIVEVVAHVALNTLTNYLNNVAGTEVDFPKVPGLAAAA